MRQLFSFPFFAACSLAALSVACSNPTSELACPAQALPALSIRVLDTTTGEGVRGAKVTVRDGSYSEILSEFNGESNDDAWGFSGPYERAGQYTIQIEKAGYADWTKTNVIVKRGVCNVKTVRIDAHLTPLAPTS